jgi:hypothetical protein
MLLSTVLTAAPAMATTADAVCVISDANLRFESSSAVGSSLGPIGPWHLSGLTGQMEVLAKGVPPSLRSFALRHEELAHHWHYGRTLNMHIALARPGPRQEVQVELVIEARSPKADGMTFSGSYVLIVQGEATLTLRGQARCRIAGYG